MKYHCIKLVHILFMLATFAFLTGTSSLDYTRKVDPLANMPEGNPDPNLGIVIHGESTGVDVLADSSQNIRFSASKNFDKTGIELLRSSSKIDRTPKKFKFIDEKYGFSSERTFEFLILFNNENLQWEFIKFMPFSSVIEWVTEDKLREYLNQWVEIFENAGWERGEYSKSDNSSRVQNFEIPTSYNKKTQYCFWTTKEYEAVIRITLRNNEDYKYYVPKAERKNIKVSPDGYIAFISIYKKSQYSN